MNNLHKSYLVCIFVSYRVSRITVFLQIKQNNGRRKKLYVCQAVLDDANKRLIYCITIRIESSLNNDQKLNSKDSYLHRVFFRNEGKGLFREPPRPLHAEENKLLHLLCTCQFLQGEARSEKTACSL